MDPTIYRSLLAINPNTNIPISTNYILSTDGKGDLSWQNVLYNISSMDYSLGFLPSTINTLNTFLYNISTGVLPGSLSTPNLTSTVDGLATIGYISSSSLKSTIDGLGTYGYVSTLLFGSTVTGLQNNLGSVGYISSLSLNSTINGLGTYGYVSSSSLRSSLIGLGTFGYVSSLNNLGSLGFVSSLSLTSTVNGLGTIGYVSSASLISSVIGVNNNLVSSITHILNNKQNIYLNTAGALVIGGSNINVTISTISSFYFYNTFYNSSINYKGNNNDAIAFNSGLDFYVSTLDTQLDRFSSFITNKTNISLEVYPNIIFPQINTNSNPQIYHVSSFIQYNGSNIGSASASAIQQTKFLAMNNSASNLFQQSLRINVPGSLINNNYSYPYLLNHRFINAYASNTNVGFSSSNVKIYMDSTSSYFLSIQNIAP
jgi:hypothetical protein